MTNKSIKSEPLTDFVTFTEAFELIGYKFKGSLENALLNGSIRFETKGKGKAVIRLLYLPDVKLVKKQLKIKMAKKAKKAKQKN